MWTRSVLLTMALLASTAQGKCPLCPETGVTCPNTIIKNTGQSTKTCASVANEMASISDTAVCPGLQKWSAACCPSSGVCPSDLPPPTPASDSTTTVEDPTNKVSVKSGPHPSCQMCRDGSFPASSSMVINMLGYGQGSCKQWYYFALEGNVEAHMCDPLQYFAWEPCQCGQKPSYPKPAPAPAPNTNNGGGNPVRKQADTDKDALRISGNRGGAGAQFHGGRRLFLKGSTSTTRNSPQ